MRFCTLLVLVANLKQGWKMVQTLNEDVFYYVIRLVSVILKG
jgi:hypothetical protein